jgi:hypothetical protein
MRNGSLQCITTACVHVPDYRAEALMSSADDRSIDFASGRPWHMTADIRTRSWLGRSTLFLAQELSNFLFANVSDG